MVPAIKGSDGPRLRRLPLLLRGADHEDAREQAHRRRLPGHQHLADQPGRDRHDRLGAAPAQRPERDHRHRLDRLPAGVGRTPRPERLKQLGVSKVMTLTSTYDHRVIQGAESGAFLRRIEQLLQGEDGFYEAVAADLGDRRRRRSPPPTRPPPRRRRSAPPPPADRAPTQPDEELLQAVQAATSLLKGYRTHGHLAARLDPLGSEPKGDPAIQPENLNLTPELMARIPASILRIGVPGETLLEALPRMREAYCGTIAYQFEHLSSHQQRTWLREMVETGAHRQPLADDEKRRLLQRLIDVFEFERFLEKAYLGPEDLHDRGPRRDRADARRAGHPRPPRRRRGGRLRDGPPRPARRPRPQPRAARSSRSWPSSRARSRSRRSRRSPRSPTAAPATSSTTTATRASTRPTPARRSPSASTRTRATSSSSTRSSRAAPRFLQSDFEGPKHRPRPASARCRSCSTATPPSPARASSPRRSTCRR